MSESDSVFVDSSDPSNRLLRARGTLDAGQKIVDEAGDHKYTVLLSSRLHSHCYSCWNAADKLTACPHCKAVRYCSGKCQRFDWVAGFHRQLCRASRYYKGSDAHLQPKDPSVNRWDALAGSVEAMDSDSTDDVSNVNNCPRVPPTLRLNFQLFECPALVLLIRIVLSIVQDGRSKTAINYMCGGGGTASDNEKSSQYATVAMTAAAILKRIFYDFEGRKATITGAHANCSQEQCEAKSSSVGTYGWVKSDEEDGKLTFRELYGYCEKISRNAFTVSSLDGGGDLGIALYIRGSASLLNHSCESNCVGHFDGKDLVIRTIRKVEAKEPLTISYVDRGEQVFLRQRRLLEGYGFLCTCERCQGELCAHLQGGLLRMKATQHWKPCCTKSASAFAGSKYTGGKHSSVTVIGESKEMLCSCHYMKTMAESLDEGCMSDQYAALHGLRCPQEVQGQVCPGSCIYDVRSITPSAIPGYISAHSESLEAATVFIYPCSVCGVAPSEYARKENNLLDALRRARRWLKDGRIRRMRKAIHQLRQIYGFDGTDVVRARNALSEACLKVQRFQEAEVHMLLTLEWYRLQYAAGSLRRALQFHRYAKLAHYSATTEFGDLDGRERNIRKSIDDPRNTERFESSLVPAPSLVLVDTMLKKCGSSYSLCLGPSHSRVIECRKLAKAVHLELMQGLRYQESRKNAESKHRAIL